MSILNQVKAKSILVVGDVMLDTYYNGEVTRISPEAPVPVFRKVSEQSVLGGAANVAANLVAAGQKVSILTIVGEDESGKKLLQNFADKKIDTTLVRKLKRNTTVKIRFMADNNQQVLRLDIEDTEKVGDDISEILLSELKDKINRFDMIIISDYLKGLLTLEFTQEILSMAKKSQIPVIVDVKDSNTDKYKGAYLLKPNLKELCTLTNMAVRTKQEIVEVSQALRIRCNCQYILTTCGANGMVLVGDGFSYSVPSEGKEVYDVTGAGDTVIAYLAACIANKIKMKDAVNISNYAAGLQVAKAGTSTVSIREVREHLTSQRQGAAHKVLDSVSVLEFRDDHADKKIVFTNGCFDILHIGHIRYLQQASLLGDILVVGVNSDDSVKRLKGHERPINSEKDRVELLSALGFVDYVIVFKEDTPYELVRTLQPDILVKGGDYSPNDVVGRDIIKSRGGEVVIIPYVEGRSTTKIIEKLRA